jgi:hypothetical protein
VGGSFVIIYHNYNEQESNSTNNCSATYSKHLHKFGSDLNAGKLEAFEAVKATLYGDNSHSKDAYNKTLQFAR